MGKHKRGGYTFQTWTGDHDPYHCHIFKDGKFVAKYNLEKDEVMEGKVNKNILKHIKELLKENKL